MWIEDKQEMLREGHVILIEETRKLKEEDAKLYNQGRFRYES